MSKALYKLVANRINTELSTCVGRKLEVHLTIPATSVAFTDHTEDLRACLRVHLQRGWQVDYVIQMNEPTYVRLGFRLPKTNEIWVDVTDVMKQ